MLEALAHPIEIDPPALLLFFLFAAMAALMIAAILRPR